MNRVVVQSVQAPPIPSFKAQCRNFRTHGEPVFDLSQAIPFYPTFPAIRERLAQSLRQDDTGFYTDVAGRPDLRSAIAARHPLVKDRDSARVLVTAGANHAMLTALMALLDAGDTVLLPEPFYFNYDMALPMLGLKADYFSLAADKGLQLEAATLIHDLETKQKVRAVILVTPNNPSGACYSASEILKLLGWTSSRGIEVIVDETYLKFDTNHLNQPALATFLGKGLTLVGSFSKSYSLTGYRIGYLISSPEMILETLKIQDTMIICPSHIGQLAALAGIESCDSDVEREVGRMLNIAEKVRGWASTWSQFSLVNAGAFFAYVRHPFTNLNSTEAALKVFEMTGVLGLPGEVFGRHQGRYLRLSISNVSESEIESAFKAISHFDSQLATEAG